MHTVFIHRPVAWRGTAEEPVPPVPFVPPLVRRRLTAVERIALALAHTAAPEDKTFFPLVFASRYGEIGQTVKLIEQFATDGEFSPAGFSSSVHNAGAGYFSILTKNTASYTSIAAQERSVEAGLLESLMTPTPVLFVYAEEATPEFYREQMAADGMFEQGCGVACYFSSEPSNFSVTCEFCTSQGMEPVTVEACTAFLTGAAKSLVSSSFVLQRGE